MSWKNFCRALSVAGLPECGEPMGHEGAHIFSHHDPEVLLDRCSVLLKEYRDALAAIQVDVKPAEKDKQEE